MLFRLVQPVKRSGSSKGQFQKRIPEDLRERIAGRKLVVPIGGELVSMTVPAKAASIRFSLRTSDPSEIKIRHAEALAHLEGIFRSLRESRPLKLTRAQAASLSGDFYRNWADAEAEKRSRTIVVEVDENGARVVDELDEGEAAGFEVAVQRFRNLKDKGEASEIERTLGPIIDRLLTVKGIPEVDQPSRVMLLEAFLEAAIDAMEARRRQAGYDFSDDPRAKRFPDWECVKPARPSPEAPKATGKASLTGLVEDWWKEAKAAGRKPSTYESYSHTMKAFVAFLKHDDASRVTPTDVVAFKGHRLASINPRTGKPISPKTVKDSDLAGLKAIFDWAVANKRMASNPAAGVTLRLSKPARLRSKGLTDEEALAILKAALQVGEGRARPETRAAKRWVPWICAYSGARVGEIAQLRKSDVRKEGEHWTVTITPEAGTVKTNEARSFPIHAHLVEQGFLEFVSKSAEGHLFLRPGNDGDVLGPLQGVKNRLGELARKAIGDAKVAPSHGWRHRFKTVGREVGIEQRVLDAIQGHSARTQGESYGDVTMATMEAAMAKVPRYDTR